MFNRRPVNLEVAFADYCPDGRQLRWQCELAQDGVERTKGAKRIAEARQAKQAAETDLQVHLDQCGQCFDRRAYARGRSKGRVFRTRTAPSKRSFQPTRHDPGRPESDFAVQYAVWRLQGEVVRVRR